MATAVPIKLSNYTKPGNMIVQKATIPPTWQSDSAEMIALCLSCELKECRPASEFCPLNRIKTSTKTKSGKPDMRRRENRPKPQPDELDLEVLRMYLNGGRIVWIASELKTDTWRVRESIKKLERIGLL